MQVYEYRVIPAPSRGERMRGAKTTQDRYAQTLAQLINAQGREGWEYLRAESLPTEERSGFTRRTTVFVNLLVFRRIVDASGEPTAQVTPPQKSFLGLGRLTGNKPAPAAHIPRIDPPGDGPAPRLGPAIGTDADTR